MHRYMPGAAVYIPKPTWANHHNIFRDAQVEQKGFRYYKPDTRGLDFEGLMEDLQVGLTLTWGAVFTPRDPAQVYMALEHKHQRLQQ